MSDDPAGPVVLPTESGTRQTFPGAALLRMATTSRRDGTFDGAWWPRSRNLGAQLPGLIRALTDKLGAVARIGLDAGAWDVHLHSVAVDGHLVRIDWSEVDDHTMLVTRGHQDIFSFLMLPWYADERAAHAAMTLAVQDGNSASATEILAATGIPAR
ncbi:DUF5994 family protein [Streptomyces sp. MNP-20]|uniref:DUF5994 family protein n=1 Tax=Streptomyces sp. MNP-20 TaxID=2721165 RepID=UPI0015544C75|nr:DUF5994 family protein [Streptomyces sp. MNP-20]